jgi:hypothetical protein
MFLALAVSAGQPTEKPAATKTVRLSVKGTKGWIQAVAFSPDGKTIAAGTSENKVVLWDLKSGKELSRVTLSGEDEGRLVSYVVFSPDSKKLATLHDIERLGEERARIHLWEITGNRRLRSSMKTRSFRAVEAGRFVGVWQVAFSPDGKSLVMGEPEGTIRLWDAATGRERLYFHGGVAAAFAPDGRTMISVSHDGMIHRWAAGTNRLIDPAKETRRKDFIHVDRVAFAPSGRLVALSDGYNTWLKDTATGRTVGRLALPDGLVPLAFSADGKTLAAAAKAGVSLFDTATGKEQNWRRGNGAVAFSGVGRRFTWSAGRSILLEEMPVLPAGKPKPPSPASHPPGVPLQAELVVNRGTYVLDLFGLTPEEFSEEVRLGSLPTPRVDLTLRLRNTSDKSVTIQRQSPPRRGLDLVSPTFVLVGRGAISIPEGIVQLSGGPTDLPKPITLAPGASHSCRITSLGDSDLSYWLLPGEYTLHARCYGAISPAPKGASDARDGYGYVELRCPPVKVKVLPARNPPADPLEKTPNVPRLGALVVPEDKEIAAIRGRLSRYVALASITEERPTLQEFVEYLADRYNLDFRIDKAAFKKIGNGRIGEGKPRAAPLAEISMGALLHTMLEPLDAGYEIRKKTVWIVPLARPQGLAERLQPADEYLRRTLYTPITLKPGIKKDTPLAKALQDLGDRFDLTVLFDQKAFERAGIKDVGKRPVQIPEQVDVLLSAVLRQLLKQAGATFVLRENIVLIIPLGQ